MPVDQHDFDGIGADTMFTKQASRARCAPESGESTTQDENALHRIGSVNTPFADDARRDREAAKITLAKLLQ